MNNPQLIKQVATEAADFDARLFGGWAGKLHGLVAPRRHNDIDVVLINPALSALDTFIAARNEILDGHLSHNACTSRSRF